MSENKNNTVLLYVGAVVALAGVVLAALLLCKQGFSGLCTASFGCSIDGVDGCKELGASPNSKVFGLIPVALLGVFYYAFLGAAFLLQAGKPNAERAGLLVYATVFGIVADLWLGYINFTQTLVPCVLCAVTYGVTAVALALALIYKRRSFPGEPSPVPLAMSALIPLAAAAIVTFIIAGIFFTAGSRSKSTGEGVSLLSPDSVPTVIRDFNALKEAKIDPSGIRSREGSDRAYIIVQKFADFLCPHCLHASYLLQEALDRWPGRIQVVYRHFPLDATCNPGLGQPDKPRGDWRCNGAQAAICAADYPGFAKFYHGVFDLQNQQLPITLEQLERISVATQIPWPALRTCMGSLETQQKLARDLRDAHAIDIHSTPTLIVNQRLLPAGNPDREQFLQLMDALVYEREGKAAFDEYRSRSAR